MGVLEWNGKVRVRRNKKGKESSRRRGEDGVLGGNGRTLWFEDGIGEEDLIIGETLLGRRRSGGRLGRGLLLQRRTAEELLAASPVELPALVLRERLLGGLLLADAHLGDLVLDVREESVDVVVSVDADSLRPAQGSGGVAALLGREAEADVGGFLEERLLEDGGGHLGDDTLR